MAKYLIGNIKGPKGDDGVSPTITVEEVTGGARITTTDANGTSTAIIRNGIDATGESIDLSPYATKAALNVVEAKIPSLTNYVSKDYLEAALPTKLSDLENDTDFFIGNDVVTSINGMTGDVVLDIETGQAFVETDPTVPAWAKLPTKPTYTADEVGALPDTTVIPDVSDLVSNDDLTTALAAKQDTLSAGTGITIENNIISATGGGSGSGSYSDSDVANYIRNTFGMGVTQTQGEEVYYEENGAEGSSVYGDAGSNPPTMLNVRFVDNGPGEELIAEYTLEKTVVDDYTISYADENNEVTMTLSEGPSWNGTLNVPASVYQNYTYYNYKIYNPIGGTTTTYSPLNREFIKVDHNTIEFNPDGELVANVDIPSVDPMVDNDILTWDSNPSGMSAQSVLGATKSQQDVYTTVVSITSELTNVDEQYNQTWSNVPINVNSLVAGNNYHYEFNDSMYGLGSSNNFRFDPNPEMGDNGLTFFDDGPAGYFTLRFDKDSNDEWIISEIYVNGEDWRTVGETITLTFSSISQQTVVNPINTEFIPIDNSTITVNSNGKLQAVGGSSGITTETDPVFTASPAATITATDIADWNAKSEFSGSYNDLTNKPDLSQYATQTQLGTGLATKQNTLTAGTNISIDNNVISATDTTYTAGTGIDITNGVISATGGDELPEIVSGDAGKVLAVNTNEDGIEWITPESGGGNVEALEIEAWDKNDSALSAAFANGTYPKLIKVYGNYYFLDGYSRGQYPYTYSYSTPITVDKNLFWNKMYAHVHVATVQVADNNGTITNVTATSPNPTFIYSNGTGITFTDNGNGNIVSVDTDVIATKIYVDNAVAGAGGGGTTYTAGNGIDITNDAISVDSSVVALQTDIPDVSGFVESADLATVATTGDYDDLTNKPTIPTVPTTVSSFTNDAGYITSSDLPSDELPAIASGDAGKVLAVNSGENGVEWTTPASSGSSLPADPAADGTYFLTTTVSSGTATQSWVTIPAANGNNF